MMRTYLTFQLYGQLSSWGDIAVGEVRPIDQLPTKSAVLGLVAAALGIKRTQSLDLLNLNESFGFAVKCFPACESLKDYHSVQMPTSKKHSRFYTRKDELAAGEIETLITSRYYYPEMYSVIALWLQEDKARVSSSISLPEIEKALKTPQYALYLGRKACPVALPLAPCVKVYPSLKHALDHALDDFTKDDPWVNLFQQNKQPIYSWECLEQADAGMSPEMFVEKRDKLRDRARWEFDRRDRFICFGGENA